MRPGWTTAAIGLQSSYPPASLVSSGLSYPRPLQALTVLQKYLHTVFVALRLNLDAGISVAIRTYLSRIFPSGIANLHAISACDTSDAHIGSRYAYSVGATVVNNPSLRGSHDSTLFERKQADFTHSTL